MGGGGLEVIHIPSLHVHLEVRFLGSLLGDDVDHAALGIGAVEDRRGPLGDLDLRHIIRRKLVQIQKAGFCLVIGHTVDQHQYSPLVEKPVDGHIRLVLPSRGNGHARDVRQGLGNGAAVGCLHLLGGDLVGYRSLLGDRRLFTGDIDLAEGIALIPPPILLFRPCDTGRYQGETGQQRCNPNHSHTNFSS